RRGQGATPPPPPRRPREIAFSLDSFLDVVANVIGIIIRLILVAWVGARSYTASMKFFDEEPVRVEATQLPPPSITDDPLHEQVRRTQADLEEARRGLL